MSKPIQEDLLFERIDNIERIIQNDQRIKFICKGHSLFLNPNDILFVESNGQRKKITTDNNSYIVNISFDEILRMAPGSFSRCHNEFVVNMKHIAKYDNDIIFMTNRNTVPVGRKHRTEFKNRCFAYKQRKQNVLK